MVRMSKTIVAGISALAMAAAVVLPTIPASAGGWGGGGWHGGGFHGGGWHGGGWGVVAFGMGAIGAAVIGTTAGGVRQSRRAC